MDIFITGYGVISAIGKNVEENFSSLIQEKTAIKQGLKSFTSKFKVGEIGLSNDALKVEFDLKTDGSRTALLGMVAAKEAFKNHSHFEALRTGLISGTSVGGMDISEVEYRNEMAGEKPNYKKYFHHPSGTTSEQIALELGITGFVNTISTACSSAANAIMMGARLIQSGQLDRVVVGGTDCLTQFTIYGFRSLMIFDDEWCKPFDNSRKGLNLGEAAAYLVLESDAIVAKENKKVLARVTGYGNANDAFHQTASSENGDGAFLAMEKAFQVANLKPEQIDYINVHGTATPNNDLSEGRAIVRVFGEKNIPDFSSTKPFTGHTLAAAAAIEAVYSVLAIQHNVVFPNLNFKTPMEEFNMIPQTKLIHKNIDHVLSNSFGFGGNCSTLIFSRN